jgi:pyrimidine-nucleoside phosphorylase
MQVQALIERKRDGGRLERAEWRALAAAYGAGDVPDYQMAAFLMACYIRGLDQAETVDLTQAMLDSGDRLVLDDLPWPRIDKHSTGGVGDKVSIVLAPLVAACGVAVPMMSGRSLGHTGGTLDKLESIPGFRTDLSLADARQQLESLQCVLIGQTAEIAPADRRMYALRDATATVDAIPLIAASIMSKKLAEGLTGLVLDIKRGSGAFLPELDRGLALADLMIRLGSDHGCPTVALVTAMDRPLGRACGNALEVEECIMALRGEGPDDLMELTYALGQEMLLLAGVATTREQAMERMQRAIVSGAAAERLAMVIEAQGGNPAVVDDPALLPQAAITDVYMAPRAGFVARVEPRAIGQGLIRMGGGRTQVDGRIRPAAGLVITARPGDVVQAGAPLATIYADDADGLAAGRATLAAAITIGDSAADPLPLISHRVDQHGAREYHR